MFEVTPEENVRIIDLDCKYNQIPVLDDDDASQLFDMYPELLLPESERPKPKRNNLFLDLCSLIKKKG